MLLRDEIQEIPKLLDDLLATRQEAAEKIKVAQAKQKGYFDRRRKRPRIYKEGDLVVIMKQSAATGVSRKLAPTYSGPMIVRTILPNDRYIVADMSGSHRTRKSAKYQRTVAVDRMRPWRPPGGVSDETDSESGDDGVVLPPESDDEQE